MWIFTERKPKNKKRIGVYPSIDHLNIALRILLKTPEVNKVAIQEICYAILKANGRFYEDVKKSIRESEIFDFDIFKQ